MNEPDKFERAVRKGCSNVLRTTQKRVGGGGMENTETKGSILEALFNRILISEGRKRGENFNKADQLLQVFVTSSQKTTILSIDNLHSIGYMILLLQNMNKNHLDDLNVTFGCKPLEKYRNLTLREVGM